jgi:aerobic-type carbon monoxide dehydrogenase small subunit (CoxS/CutS family)
MFVPRLYIWTNADDLFNCMAGNICRCGTYLRIREAIHVAAKDQQTK